MDISLRPSHRALRAGLLSLFALLATSIFSTAQCTPGPTNQTVTICSPTDGATIASPVNVVASTTDSNTVNLVQIYVDHV